MDTTDVNTAIDDKKNENSGDSSETDSSNWGGFISSLIMIIIHLLLWLGFIGPIILYLCKLAQANVLPSHIGFVPYSDTMLKVEEIPININVIKHKKKEFSAKLFFSQDKVNDDYLHGMIGFLKVYQHDPKKANFYGNFWAIIIFNILSFNFGLIDSIFEMINKTLPETIILFISPFIFLFLLIGFYFLNMGLTFYYQIKFFNEFFLVKKIEHDKVEWKKHNIFFEPLRWFWAFLSLIFVFFPATILLPFLTLNFSIFSPLFITGKIDKSRPYSFLDFIKDNLFYKSNVFLVLLSILMLPAVANNLSTYYLAAFILAIIILCFKHYYEDPKIADDPSLTLGLAPSTKARLGKFTEVEMANRKVGGGSNNKNTNTFKKRK
jgi:hypothetical protein